MLDGRPAATSTENIIVNQVLIANRSLQPEYERRAVNRLDEHVWTERRKRTSSTGSLSVCRTYLPHGNEWNQESILRFSISYLFISLVADSEQHHQRRKARPQLFMVITVSSSPTSGSYYLHRNFLTILQFSSNELLHQ